MGVLPPKAPGETQLVSTARANVRKRNENAVADTCRSTTSTPTAGGFCGWERSETLLTFFHWWARGREPVLTKSVATST